MPSPHPPPHPHPLPHSDALLALTRQTTHLQSTLQTLLDAQSEGLLAGLAGTGTSIPAAAGDDDDETTSSTTTTPTDSMIRSHVHQQRGKGKGVMPVRQPARKKVGLRGARRGIGRMIKELEGVKREEGRVLCGEVEAREGVLETLEGFERKCMGLREGIRGIESEEDARRVERLKGEERRLGVEIEELETRLWEMKARRKALGREIEGLGNSVQSRLSSYEAALGLAESDIRGFLARPPLQAGGNGTTTGVWALPKERRTLEMAREWYGKEREALNGRLEGVEAEARALEEGGEVWREVVEVVDGVERALREEMQRMQSPLVEVGDGESAKGGMERVLQTMRDARAKIEEKLDHAERRDWKLLICCVGAELEALIEGQAVLEAAMEAAAQSGGKPRIQRNGESQGQENGNIVKEHPLVDDGSVPMSSAQGIPSPAQGLLDGSEDEDDGPGPELLISHHDE